MDLKVPLSLEHLVVSASGRFAGLLGRTGHAQLLDLERGKKRWNHKLGGPDGRHQALNDRLWVVSCDKQVHVFDVSSGAKLGTIRAHERERTYTPVVALDAQDTIWVPEGADLVGYAPDGTERARRAVHERGGTSSWLVAEPDGDALLLFSTNPVANERLFLVEATGTRSFEVPHDYVPGAHNYETRAWFVGERVAALRKSRGLTWFDRATEKELAHHDWAALGLRLPGAQLSPDGRWLIGMAADDNQDPDVLALRLADGQREPIGTVARFAEPPSLAFDAAGVLYVRELRYDSTGRKRTHHLRRVELPR